MAGQIALACRDRSGGTDVPQCSEKSGGGPYQLSLSPASVPGDGKAIKRSYRPVRKLIEISSQNLN